jgi:hypothetical protein
MKKTVGIIIGVLIAALVIYAVMPKKKFIGEAVGLETLIPKDAVAYYSAKDFKGTWTLVKDSNFWKQLSGLQIWKDLKTQDNFNAFSKSLSDSLGFELTEGKVMDVIGDEVALAIVVGARNDTEPKVLILTKTGTRTQLAETAAKLIDKAKGAGASAVETWNYGDMTLTHVKSNDPTAPEINYVFLGNVLALGIGNTREVLQNVVDLSKGKSNDSIGQTEGYQKLLALEGKTGSHVVGKFYMDFDKITQTVGGVNLPVPGGAPANVAAPLAMLKSIGGVTWIENGLNTRIVVVPNKANMDETTRSLWDVKPQKPVSMDFIPEGTVLYSVSNSLDVSGLWKIWQTNLSKQAPEQAKAITDAIETAEKSMGMSIEGDILSWIGDEIAYTFNEVNVEGIFPIPKMALIVKVKDEEKAKAFLAKLVDMVNQQAATPGPVAGTAEETAPAVPSFQLKLEKSTYGGVEISSMNVPLVGKGLAPGYAFIKGFLVIASGSTMLEKMVDVSQNKGNSIISDPNYRKVSSALSGEVNQLGYINTEKMFDVAVDICNWVVAFQQMNVPGTAIAPAQAEATKKILSETVIPILKCLKAVKVVGISTVYTKEGIEQNIVTRIEDVK